MKKVIAILLALVMVIGLAACGTPANDNNSANTIEENTANIAENITNNENTEPPEPPKPLYTNPLTGEETETDISGNRPFAISMNNQVAAIPMHGITAADIMIEMTVENGVTRIFSMFHDIDSSIRKIGSIRSARPYFLDWALTFDAIYITAGGSDTANYQIPRRNVAYVNCDHGRVPSIFYRDPERTSTYAWEHTLFASGEGFEKHREDLPVDLNHKEGYECTLKFTNTAQTADGEKAENFTVIMNPVKSTLFEYDSEKKLYFISQHGRPFMDGNNDQQVCVKNVLVLPMSYWPEYAGAITLAADTSGGEGQYFCEGKVIEIKWTRTDDEGLILMKEDGSPLELAVGKTYICCSDLYNGKVEIK